MPYQSKPSSPPSYPVSNLYPMQVLRLTPENGRQPPKVPYPPQRDPPMSFYKRTDTRPWKIYFFIMLALFFISVVVFSTVWAVKVIQVNKEMAKAKEIEDSAHNITVTVKETAISSWFSTSLSTTTSMQPTTLSTTLSTATTFVDFFTLTQPAPAALTVTELTTVFATSTVLVPTTVVFTVTVTTAEEVCEGLFC